MKLLIAGAGGHGRVVADAALACGAFSAVAFIDDRYPDIILDERWPVLGTLEALPLLSSKYGAFVSAFGDAALRLKTLTTAGEHGFHLPPIIHPTAVVSRHAFIGEGSVVFAVGVINLGARVGRGCIINTGATVDHDCDLADGVHMCPGAHLAGNVALGARTWFGIGAVAKQGVRIGSDVIIGAGTIVISDVADNEKVVGNPARALMR